MGVHSSAQPRPTGLREHDQKASCCCCSSRPKKTTQQQYYLAGQHTSPVGETCARATVVAGRVCAVLLLSPV